MSSENYYIPEQSKIPLFMALSLGMFVLGASNAMINKSYFLLVIALVSIISVMFVWFRLAIAENLAGKPNMQVKRSYVLGMSWFIISEVFFFLAFFGALFYVRMLAVPWLGGEGVGTDTNRLLWDGFEAQWPVMTNPDQVNPGKEIIFQAPHKHMGASGLGGEGFLGTLPYALKWLPLWNTIVLLLSSLTCHFAHTHLKQNNRKGFNIWLGITITLAIIFLGLQYLEYHEAYADYGLTLNSGIYGTTFFMLTGFHGFHVLMGTIMLTVQFLRSLKGHFSADDHFGFEASSWYWHFVDVVWVGLFIFVYVLS